MFPRHVFQFATSKCAKPKSMKMPMTVARRRIVDSLVWRDLTSLFSSSRSSPVQPVPAPVQALLPRTTSAKVTAPNERRLCVIWRDSRLDSFNLCFPSQTVLGPLQSVMRDLHSDDNDEDSDDDDENDMDSDGERAAHTHVTHHQRRSVKAAICQVSDQNKTWNNS